MLETGQKSDQIHKQEFQFKHLFSQLLQHEMVSPQNGEDQAGY